ncbi:9279_t:CDS:2 [Paraglomus brasilianum]|uniref:9279_t:CDS:1 n=1 Tax=Paraglomus brasilianum TaxID=144538 RepID=A0A9N8VIA0_9GLOM|nr:9279_t:CDS:2 [Paraglomus brasilianum]
MSYQTLPMLAKMMPEDNDVRSLSFGVSQVYEYPYCLRETHHMLFSTKTAFYEFRSRYSRLTTVECIGRTNRLTNCKAADRSSKPFPKYCNIASVLINVCDEQNNVAPTSQTHPSHLRRSLQSAAMPQSGCDFGSPN